MNMNICIILLTLLKLVVILFILNCFFAFTYMYSFIYRYSTFILIVKYIVPFKDSKISFLISTMFFSASRLFISVMASCKSASSDVSSTCLFYIIDISFSWNLRFGTLHIKSNQKYMVV